MCCCMCQAKSLQHLDVFENEGKDICNWQELVEGEALLVLTIGGFQYTHSSTRVQIYDLPSRAGHQCSHVLG